MRKAQPLLVLIAAVVATMLTSASAQAARNRPCTKMPPGAKTCVLVPFSVWYCRGLMQPEWIVFTHPTAPGPACKRGLAWFERFSA